MAVAVLGCYPCKILGGNRKERPQTFLWSLGPQQQQQAEPLEIKVRGLAGYLCSFDATIAWTVSEAKSAIADRSQVPEQQLVLIYGTKELRDEEATLVSAAAHAGFTPRTPTTCQELVLTLLRVEEPPPQEALTEAIEAGDTVRAHELLEFPRLRGLNVADRDGRSVLSQAIRRRLPTVALTILQRDDFVAVNQKDRDDRTALHYAAFHGQLDVCKAILTRADFKELQAKGQWGRSARSMAARNGHVEVVRFLEAAEEGHLP